MTGKTTWLGRIPNISWMLLLITIAAGAYLHAESPYGILLHTPRDWCAARRMHGFSLGFFAVLFLCTAAYGLIAIGGWMARAGIGSGRFMTSLAQAFLPSIASLLLFIAAAPVGVIVSELLPLKIDPRCH
ncbi:hypothetical protein HSX11_20425 [Oxalobacteraceae bacterium]|nr:hypothetical protein [Oxalobacteraceae bacterium]